MSSPPRTVAPDSALPETAGQHAVGRRPVPRSLRRNFSWTFVGNLIYTACQWGQLVVLAKFLEPADVGVFALGLAITAPLIFFANLGLRTIQVTDKRNDFQFADYLGLRLTSTVLALAAIVGIALVTQPDPRSMAVIVVLGLGKSFDNTSDIIHGLFQKAEHMEPIAWAMMLNGLSSIILMAVLVIATRDVLLSAVGTAAGSAIALTVYTIPVGARLLSQEQACVRTRLSVLLPRWHGPALWQLSRLAVPLGFAYMLTSLNPNIPRYVIQHDLGSRSLGIYAALAYLMVAGPTLMGPLSQAALPRASDLYAHRQVRQFTVFVGKLIAFAAACGIAGFVVVVAVGKPVVTLIYRSEYANSMNLLLWLTVAMGLSFIIWFLDIGISAAHRFRIQAPINIAMIGTSAGASLLLIPRYGLVGAAWATCLAFAVQGVLKAIVLASAIVAIAPGREA